MRVAIGDHVRLPQFLSDLGEDSHLDLLLSLEQEVKHFLVISEVYIEPVLLDEGLVYLVSLLPVAELGQNFKHGVHLWLGYLKLPDGIGYHFEAHFDLVDLTVEFLVSILVRLFGSY